MSQDKKWYEGSHEEYWDRILSLPSPQSWELEHRYLIEALRERGEEIEDLGWTFDFWNSGGNTMLVMLWDKTSSEEWGVALAKPEFVAPCGDLILEARISQWFDK